MAKIQQMQSANRTERNEIATEVARICGVTDRYVRMVINGDRENEKVLTAYIEYQKGKSQLIQAIEKLVPFIN